MMIYALLAETSGEVEPNGKFFPHDIKEFWWGGAAFLIVVGFLAWKLLPVIRKALDDGQQAAVDEATTADKALAEARAQEAELRAELGDADQASQRIIAEARETAAQLRVDQNTRTQELVDQMWSRAQGEVASMGGQLNSDVSAEVSSKALSAAEAVVTGNLDDTTQAQLIEDYIAKVGAAR